MKLPRAIARLERGAPLLVMLDLDGTIADFKVDPAKVALYPGVREVLAKLLARENTRIVIVTGRRARQAFELVGFEAIDVVGLHGREWLTNGRSRIEPVAASARRALDRLLVLVDRIAKRTAGARAEDKRPGGVVLHTRGAPPAKASAAEAEFVDAIRAHAAAGIALMTGKRMAEARVSGATKGTAAERLAREAIAAAKKKRLPAPVILFAGDDVTDEDAHRDLRKFDALTILVARRARPTAARFRVPSIAALRGVLRALAC